MLNNSRIGDYLDSLCPGNSAVIEEIRNSALEAEMPIIRRDGEQFLRTMIALKKPEAILEIGTCVGYSAIVMASEIRKYTAVEPSAHIITVEIGEKDYNKALSNISKAGFSDIIRCILGDAGDILKEMDQSFDMVFMDAAKAQYINWLPDVERIVKTGGVLISDNVLQDGTVAESRYSIDRRDRTTHSRMREYLFELTHSRSWETSVINIADGMSVSVRKREHNEET